MLPVRFYKCTRFVILYNYYTENFSIAQFLYFHQIEICPLHWWLLGISEMQKLGAQKHALNFFALQLCGNCT